MNRQTVIAVCGVKNTGKSTVIQQLLPILAGRGYRTAVIKHDAHDFEPDVPGTDTYRYKQAGAYGTAIYSAHKYMLVKEEPAMTAERLMEQFSEADLIIIEGLKYSHYPKIELVRGDTAAETVCDPATVLAYISDGLPEQTIPVYGYDEMEAVADVIERFMRKQEERILQEDERSNP